jgi:hypothetical protein
MKVWSERLDEPARKREPRRSIQVRSKSNGSSVAPVWDDMDELHLIMVGFIENPVTLEGEAGEIGRVVVICFADAGEARDQGANRHEIGDEFIACMFPKLFVDVKCDVISLAAEGRCKEDAPHASMERAPSRRWATRRFISSKITGCDDDALTFLQLPVSVLDSRAAFRACRIGEHGAGIIINRYDCK